MRMGGSVPTPHSLYRPYFGLEGLLGVKQVGEYYPPTQQAFKGKSTVKVRQ